MGTYIDGVIETRTAGGAWEMKLDLRDFDLGKARDARACLFGYGGIVGVERPLFDQRGWPEDACDEVPKECDELNHSHSYATWAEIAAVDWDAPLSDGLDANRLGEWRPGPDGELVLDDVVWAPIEVLDAAEELFGEDLFPSEWPPGGEAHLNGSVYRPVVLTARMFVPPDGRWAPVWASMSALAAEYGDENVRLVVWFG
ncbi:hypothetical protein SBI_06178 [Streptomyces bingchenggensis BCW-1]|uniref:Uncharacterized protein n=1 Tax=Streptomyces bingchenggensis (strain BCW-1) TaxID=749414 RepID=D7BQT1_STRBB|nr:MULTISPECIES: hypothetical protein [Streptomyces]ADI09298.1 hypothetical protein SBI_06178 [Streptomyces bingchenggensis BCW-1]